jgi:predicted Zn-dependent peptidase
MKKTLFTLTLCVMILTQFTLAGDEKLDRTKKPAAGPTPALKLPEMQKASLTNGLQIVVVEHHELPVVQMQLLINTGSVVDPAEKAGVASLTARLLNEGTAKRTSLQIADELAFLGSMIGASAAYDASQMTMLTLKGHLAATMEIFADVLLNPTFPQQEYDRVQKEVLTSLLQQKDQPTIVANNAFNTLLYGVTHPYGKQIGGTEKSVKSITADDLKNFYSTNYRPNNATLIVVGDITSNEIKKLAEEHLGKWEKKSVPAATVGKSPKRMMQQIYLIDKPKAAQSEIRVGHVGVPRLTPDFFALQVLNTILGGQFTSRLNLNLREDKGYTYGARSGYNYRKAAGPFFASAAVKTEVTDSSVIEFMKELNRMCTENVTEKEIEFAKASLIRSLPATFETPAQIAGQVGNLVLYGLPGNYYNTYMQNIQAVTIQDVRRAAEKYIRPNEAAIVIVGDVSVIKPGLEKLPYGKITMCDADGNVIQ